MGGKKTKLTWVALLGLIVLKPVFDTVWASTKLHMENILHVGWNSARDDLRKTFQFETGDADISEDVKNEYIECVVDEAVTFLNKTPCSYKYNPILTTSEEHVRNQDSCLQQNGYNAHMEKMVRSCARRSLLKTH